MNGLTHFNMWYVVEKQHYTTVILFFCLALWGSWVNSLVLGFERGQPYCKVFMRTEKNF